LVWHGVAACAQSPAPLHPPAGVSIPAKQVWLPQAMLAVGNWQVGVLPLPLHCALHAPLPLQAVRAGVPPVRGSPTTVTQVPSEPGSLHEPHWAAQSLLQQYPSAHRPEVHSVPAVHVRPFGLPAVQVPASQKGRPTPAASHCASPVQAFRQSVPEQPMAQLIITMGPQDPAPSQPAADVRIPPEQLCARQLVAGPG
jgi:hypothetical protein